jgi:hypothetical protein
LRNSGNDRYRGIKNLRTLIFMNRHDMRDRDIKEFDDVDILATARDGSTRSDQPITKNLKVTVRR